MGSKFWEYYPLVVEGMLQALPPGFTFYLSNLEKVVFKAPADSVPGVKVGEPYIPYGPSGTAIRTEQTVTMELDVSYYGEPIKVWAAPIFDDEQPDLLLGAFAISLSRDSAFALRNLANTYQVGTAEMGLALKRLAMESQEVKISNVACTSIFRISSNPCSKSWTAVAGVKKTSLPWMPSALIWK